MNTFIELSCVIAEILMLYMFFDHILEKRKISNIKSIIIWGTFAIILLLLSFAEDFAFIRLAYTTISIVIISLTCYNSTLLKSLFSCMIFLVLIILSDVATSLIAASIGVDITSINSGTHIAYMIFGHIIMFGTLYIAIAFSPNADSDYNMLVILPVIPCLLVTFIFCMVITKDYLSKNINIPYQYLIITLGLLYTNILFLYYSKKTNTFLNEKNKNTIALNHYKSQENYYKQLLAYQEDVKSLWHDLNKFAKANQINESSSMDELRHQIDSISLVADTNNNVLNIILSDYIRRAEAISCKIELDIQVPDKLPISTIDLYIIIGNSMDNALSACSNIEESKRIISLIMRFKNMMFYYEISNYYGPNQVKHTNPSMHGYGVKNIKKCASKYNGDTIITKENNRYKLSVRLNTEN